MPLSDSAILAAMDRGEIKLDPFRRSCLQPNSYDMHLGRTLVTYTNVALDAKEQNKSSAVEMSDNGHALFPGRLYLGVTEEYTETAPFCVPYIDGKSSIGRLGLFVHVTAGGGDAGFKGFFTLELVVVQPLIVYPGMPIAQIRYEPLVGEVQTPYGRATSKYQGQPGVPVPSMMWKNWDPVRKSWLPDESK